MALTRWSANDIGRLNALVRGALIEHIVFLKAEAKARGAKTWALGFGECCDSFLALHDPAIRRFKLEAQLPIFDAKNGKRFMDRVNKASQDSISSAIDAMIAFNRELAIAGGVNLKINTHETMLPVHCEQAARRAS